MLRSVTTQAHRKDLEDLFTQLDASPDAEGLYLALTASYSSVVAAQRRLWRRYLIRRSGVDPRKQRVVRDVPRELWPDEYLLVDAIASYAFFDKVYRGMNAASERAEADWADVRAAARAGLTRFMDDMERSFASAAAGMTAPLDDAYRVGKTIATSAAMAARLSLTRNKRLADALSTGDERPFEALLRELPAAVTLPWNDRPSDEDPDTL